MITATLNAESVLAKPLVQSNAQLANMPDERLATPLAPHNEAVQPEMVDTVELSDEYLALMTGEVAGVQFDANQHAGVMSTAGEVPTSAEVNESYSEARLNAMPKSPTLEDVKEVILRKMTRAADQAFFQGVQHDAGVTHATIAAQMGAVTPQAALDVQTMQSVQSMATVQPVPRTSGAVGYKPMSSRAVASTAQSSIRVTV
ncbi:hypothetical protein [Halodesulfovibrio marinisediminis]|uniref:Uncharacterized protein n=1 Tax=Halodesulfovibrio marinisediminis DSM 17456 TaxID=1121457 RepID=A0A1N6J9M4_9BACT|nr:hypothetical protein [Halodesulfovibrio marinisediminis]SIO40816.1 hypothetical protein SAMN02745161_3242 [Halodesulfovibrio marinisediminis DSM 17456]